MNEEELFHVGENTVQEKDGMGTVVLMNDTRLDQTEAQMP